MGVLDTTRAAGIPPVEAIISGAIPESLLKAGKTYLTSLGFDKTLTYKTLTYTPPRLSQG
jgi:hypothetical protein